MHRIDDSNFLLYIEPSASQKEEPIDDELTQLLERAISEAECGTANYSDLSGKVNFHEDSGWRGFHWTECGEMSDNKDYRLKNGMITSSLAPFYMKYYRSSIPEKEMKKVHRLKEYYENL